MASCSSCKAPIEWALLDGRPHPLDLGESPEGNLVELMPEERRAAIAAAGKPVRSGQILVRAISKAKPALPLQRRRMSHFATCPNRAQHRKGKR